MIVNSFQGHFKTCIVRCYVDVYFWLLINITPGIVLQNGKLLFLFCVICIYKGGAYSCSI